MLAAVSTPLSETKPATGDRREQLLIDLYQKNTLSVVNVYDVTLGGAVSVCNLRYIFCVGVRCALTLLNNYISMWGQVILNLILGLAIYNPLPPRPGPCLPLNHAFSG